MRISIPQTEWMDDDYHGYFFNVSGSSERLKDSFVCIAFFVVYYTAFFRLVLLFCCDL